MADPALKVVPAATAPKRKGLRGKLGRGRLRFILLIALPVAALAIGLGVYLEGGRYISTDNAYVGSQKVFVTPDISGKIARIFVKEGQHVVAGDRLFEIDPEPYRLALAQADAKLAGVRTDFTKLKGNLVSLTKLADLAAKNVELKQNDVERKSELLSRGAGTQSDRDTAASGLVTAQLQAQFTSQQRGDTLNQLLNNPDLPIEQFPPYQQAKAARDQAQRDLDHTVLRASITGNATQVDSIQLGRFVSAGSPVFSIVDDAHPWVDANPKETDITYLRAGQKVSLDVDSFPDHTFHGTVASVSPGTGSQFSILPAQNASGNWVKVVQRVPVRIVFDRNEDLHNLRAGMSVAVSIDTKHRRTFGALLGITSAAQGAAEETR
jgi:membrane fusion protein (multidrug efflux system)